MEATDHKATIDSLLGELAFDMRQSYVGADKGVIRRVCCDSRRVAPGDIFVAVCGSQVDGHDYIEQAIQRGATFVVAERGANVSDRVQLRVVEDSAAALGYLAQASFGRPSEQMKVMGVTGTNGKTTVTYLVRRMLQEAGINCGLLGTVEYDLGEGEMIKADNTTPDAMRLAEMMGRMRDNGSEAVVMECSSHGLDQQRTAGIRFAAAAFTNLSGDHLDYHGSEQEYLQAKGKLFQGLTEHDTAIINGEDKASRYLAEITPARIWRFGFAGDLEITARLKNKGIWGSEFDLQLFDTHVSVRSRLIGNHNVSNCLTASGLALAYGIHPEAIAAGINKLPAVPGRLERIDEAKDFTVLVDYAHTDDALEHSLATVRGLAQRNVLVVFGCGGERDRTKRPRMAQVAQKYADKIFVTDDNPRRENAQSIRTEILTGFSPAQQTKVEEIADRYQAIAAAITRAAPGDVVLIAGKGHEDYQIVGEEILDFDDRRVARDVIENRRVHV